MTQIEPGDLIEIDGLVLIFLGNFPLNLIGNIVPGLPFEPVGLDVQVGDIVRIGSDISWARVVSRIKEAVG